MPQGADAMNALEQRRWRAPTSAFERELDAALGELFSRWPSLQGFSVQLEDGMFLADVTVYPGAWSLPSEALHDDIAVSLLELVDSRPQAAELLHRRTFARAIH